MFRWRTTIAATVALCGLAVTAFWAGWPAADADALTVVSAQGRVHGAGSAPFGIASAGKGPKGLYPGVARDLPLMLRNPNEFPITVQTLGGEVTATSKRKCQPSRANVIVKAYTGRLPLVVPARSSVRVGSLPLAMPRDASRDCAGVAFTIRLKGTARKGLR